MVLRGANKMWDGVLGDGVLGDVLAELEQGITELSKVQPGGAG